MQIMQLPIFYINITINSLKNSETRFLAIAIIAPEAKVRRR